MRPERWERIDNLLQSALARLPQERSAFLAQACADDELLRTEVEALIASHEDASNILEAPMSQIAADLFINSQAKLRPDQKIGQYKIIEPLGSGGMGEVYLAQDTKLHRKIALKILPGDLASNRERMRRFEQEAEAAASLNHPHIAHIYEIGEADGVHFIAMEHIDGETLRHRTSTRMRLTDILDIAAQVASALAAAHMAGIIHRDIKPENIMLRRDGYIKVLDFGLAKLTHSEGAAANSEAFTKSLIHTEAGIVMGTAAYMSPEQARGDHVDARSDIWSLGVVLYELVAGRVAFDGETASHVTVSILESEPKPLANFADVPAELDRIVGKALRKDKAERYQRAGDLARDLKSLKQELELDARVAERLQAKTGGTKSDAAGRARPSTDASASGASTADVAQAHATSSAEYIVGEIRRHKRGVALAALVGTLAVTLAVYFLFLSKNAEAIDSIAILPFVNASNDPNAEYLSDGITESIISNLSQLPRLRVMAHSTVFRLKGQEVNPKEIGRRLNVQAVLMGRVLQQGERLVIRAELVRAADGTQLWGAEYDRQLADTLSVQHEIAREISERLRLRLTREERTRLTGRDTDDPAAYQSYLRGRFFWNKRTSDGLKKAIGEFQRAIERDPAYALGYVGLADSYAVLEDASGTPSSEALPKARAAADRALQIDDSLAEAHTSSANIYMRMWRWAEAEEEFKRVISLNPNYPTAHYWFSIYFRNRRQFDDALREAKRALELDPLSPFMNDGVAVSYYLKGDIDAAIEQGQSALELDPNFVQARRALAFAYLKRQRYEEATAALQEAVELSGRDSVNLGVLGYYYAVTGKRAEARQLLEELEAKYARRESLGQHLAEVYIGLGEKDQAFMWLEKDFEQRSGRLPHIAWRYVFDDVRSDPRYMDLVRRMGLQP